MQAEIKLPGGAFVAEMDAKELRDFLLSFGKETVAPIRLVDETLVYIALQHVLAVVVTE